MRSMASLVLAIALAGAVCLLPMIGAVRNVLGVGPIDVAIAMGVVVVLMIAGAVLYRIAPPPSRAYRTFDRVETVLVQVATLSLVLASGRGDSFFWLLWITHVTILGGYAKDERFNATAIGGLSIAIAFAFVVVEGKVAAAVMSIVIGALALYIYWLALSVNRRLAIAEAELSAARLREERERIARDIHDGLGADLAALDWRLRSVREEGSPALRAELDEIAGRLGEGTRELRAIVWALRTPSRSWSEIVAYLRTRIAELCGDRVAFEIVDEGDGGIGERTGELALDYLRGVLELVHNAVRHAQPTTIRVVLRSRADGLTAVVEDDGRGLPRDVLDRDEGGLANLRVRTKKSGGALVVSPAREAGTRLELTFLEAA